MLLVDNRTPDGCVGVVLENSNTCDDTSTFNFDVGTVACENVATPQEIVCGTGTPPTDSATGRTIGVAIIACLFLGMFF